jgi:ribonuclease HI
MTDIYIDGASSGNPGKSGIGYVIYRGGAAIVRESISLGVQTNNFAEYMALVFSLVGAMSLNEKECRVFSDSELLCEQINGNYKVKNANLYPLFVLAKKIIKNFDSFTITHIAREKNSEADKLAKNAAQNVGNEGVNHGL